MTHDGTYRIENGAVTHPVAGMRWNDSVLREVVDSGMPSATGEFFPMVMPALKMAAFHFAS